jgi:hypothetical protein
VLPWKIGHFARKNAQTANVVPLRACSAADQKHFPAVHEKSTTNGGHMRIAIEMSDVQLVKANKATGEFTVTMTGASAHSIANAWLLEMERVTMNTDRGMLDVLHELRQIVRRRE